VLIKENPGNTYQLQGGKIRLNSYLGKRVEVTGTESPTLSTSQDALNKTGNASPVTIAVQSIHTLAEECEKPLAKRGLGFAGDLRASCTLAA
jgi:hypothetical protein